MNLDEFLIQVMLGHVNIGINFDETIESERSGGFMEICV